MTNDEKVFVDKVLDCIDTLILNGKIELSEMPYEIRIRHDRSYIYAVRYARIIGWERFMDVVNILMSDMDKVRQTEDCKYLDVLKYTYSNMYDTRGFVKGYDEKKDAMQQMC